MSDAPRQTILVVDDDPMDRTLLREELIREGYQVVESPSGDEALTLLEELSPDVILLDIFMPDKAA